MKRKIDQVDEIEPPNGCKKVADNTIACFRPGLLDPSETNRLHEEYASSKPYRHGVIGDLIEPQLLRKVRDEITQNLSFSPKETDIYRIHQSGDLANLDGLDDSSLAKLPSLKRLRDALYSPPFRTFLAQVADTPPLSGQKTDMAINVYTPGCHLLCHDDVIGSRRVSYILYLTDPDNQWQPDWGGALRLYPTDPVLNATGTEIHVPRPDHSECIPPAFNQLSFFAVQPGQSFHDVEEVYAPANPEESRIRMAISGWFHIPQPGEQDHVPGEEEEAAVASSLAQLKASADVHDRPTPSLELVPDDGAAEVGLSEAELDFLLQYISPGYLTPDTLDGVTEAFEEECSAVLDDFLCEKFATTLREEIQRQEAWRVACPPHKHRYMYNREFLPQALFTSEAFRKWLEIVTRQVITSQDVLCRRFRRGKDYTLAQGYEYENPRLELCLAITPSQGWNGEVSETGEPMKRKAPVRNGDQELDFGGHLVYMAADEDEPEPVGQASSSKDPAIYQSSKGDDDSILFNMPASWNKLVIVLRDKSTMRFVKYVSRQAPGDRWDVMAEYGIAETSQTSDSEPDADE